MSVKNVIRLMCASVLMLLAVVSSQSLPTVPVYSYSVPAPTGTSGYAPNGNLLSYSDSINGSWSMQDDSLNRLQTARGGRPEHTRVWSWGGSMTPSAIV